MLAHRNWVPADCENRVGKIATWVAQNSSANVAERIQALADRNREIHERECFNLNPATNVMNPRAEALLASAGIGSRPSLGYPGDKYEMGLEAIEEIEVMAAALCAPRFSTRNLPRSGCRPVRMANLYGFMATCKARVTRSSLPPAVHRWARHPPRSTGCAGLYGLRIIVSGAGPRRWLHGRPRRAIAPARFSGSGRKLITV